MEDFKFAVENSPPSESNLSLFIRFRGGFDLVVTDTGSGSERFCMEKGFEINLYMIMSILGWFYGNFTV